MANLSPALEVHVRHEGGVLHLVCRYRPRALLLVVGMLTTLVSVQAVLRQRGQEELTIVCSRPGGACVLSDRGSVIERLPVAGTRRFEVRHTGRRRGDWTLVARTAEGDVSLLWGHRRTLDAAAAELNRFLDEPARAEHVFRDPRGPYRTAGPWVLLGMNALLLGAFLRMAIDRRTTFDRSRGVAVRRLTLLPSTRRLGRFRAVQVRSLADEARVRFFPTVEHERRRIVLVAADGSAWWVTLYQPPRGARTDLDAAAAALARYLGLPLEVPMPPLRAAS